MNKSRDCKRIRMLVVSMTLVMAGSATQAGELWNNVDVNSVLEHQDPFVNANAVVIDDASLDGMRGGFTISGLDLKFGATLSTMIDDIMYQTMMDISETGAKIISQSLIDPRGQAVIVNPQGGQSIVEFSPGNIKVPGLSQFSGVVLNDHKGFTTALHNITRNAIVGSVIGDASNRAIAQELKIDIQINNIDALRNASTRSMILHSLSR